MKLNQGPLIIIEDDPDDQEIIIEILQSIGVSQTILFKNSSDAWNYLQKTKDQPFLIMCDINLPKLNGIEFRLMIIQDEKLRKKSIPFIFFSTNANSNTVDIAYELTVQGFFIKPDTYAEIKNFLTTIVNYWTYCKHPNNSSAV